MARVEATEVVEVIERRVPGVVLSLTEDEALVLSTVLSRVGGDPAETVRSKADAILFALRDAGVDYRQDRTHAERLNGHLQFASA